MDIFHRVAAAIIFTVFLYIIVRFVLPLAGAVSSFLIHLFRFMDKVILPT